MNKLKINTSQSKIKLKIPSPSPTNRKPNNQPQTKINNLNTPRNHRLHTLETKKNIDIIPNNHTNTLRTPLVLPPEDKSTHKDYDTPKFKQQQKQKYDERVHIQLQNFFSFGGDENCNIKEKGKGKLGKQIQRQRVRVSDKQVYCRVKESRQSMLKRQLSKLGKENKLK